MNLAIDYQLRNKRAHALLAMPCAMFLKTSDDKKLVVGLHNAYISSNNLIVKHWRLWESTDGERLPPFTEYRVSREEAFTSPHTVVSGCKIMDYEAEPYEAGVKQYADYPHAYTQQADYSDTLLNFHNSLKHRERKLNWLWQAFEMIHVPEHLRFEYGKEDPNGRQLQRELVQFYSKSIWGTWLYWRKHMLDFEGPAPELVFRREYVPTEPREPTWTQYGTIVTNNFGFTYHV